MAMMVVERYKDKDPLFVCLLRGGAPFATKLMLEITKVDPSFNPEMDYMIIKTYGNRREGMASELVTDLAPDTQAKDRWGAHRTHQRFVSFLTKRPVPAILDYVETGTGFDTNYISHGQATSHRCKIEVWMC